MTDTATRQKFDGLASGYDTHRPRYPKSLFALIAHLVEPRNGLNIVDLGAGTGVALEGLVPIYGTTANYQATDISSDMVAVGQRKFPFARWTVETAESFIEHQKNVDLIVLAQALQWMDRPRIYRASKEALSSGGMLAILQNNRDYQRSEFLSRYEGLLEEMSPGYRRDYRSFNFQTELADVFEGVGIRHTFCSTSSIVRMEIEAFVGMSSSSTQVQRAVANHGDLFFERLRALAADFAKGEVLDIRYESQLIGATLQ